MWVQSKAGHEHPGAGADAARTARQKVFGRTTLDAFTAPTFGRRLDRAQPRYLTGPAPTARVARWTRAPLPPVAQPHGHRPAPGVDVHLRQSAGSPPAARCWPAVARARTRPAARTCRPARWGRSR